MDVLSASGRSVGALRLRGILDEIISEEQSVFVPDASLQITF
jgi:hypothetical protein